MKRSFTILTAAFMLLAFLAIPMGMMGQTRTEVVAYTLEPVAGSNNSYTGNCDITIDGITWNLTGNSQMIPWRIGGKNLAGVNRTLYSKTAIDDNVSSISVTHGNVNLTVNSWTVVVASDASFNNVVSTLTPTFAANTTTTIARPTEADWSGCYYKFEYNVTAGSSNKYLEFSGAVFYKEEGSGPVIATPTFDPVGGDYFTTQNVTISCETQGASIYYTTDGSTPDNTSTQYNGAITVSETTTIKAIAYVGDDASSMASATYNIVQPLTTMQAIFDKATEVGNTATYAYITLGNWVVSGVSTNGKNVFVTDGTKGFVIYDGGGNTGFATGNILSGTVYCKVQLYNGFAELTLLNSTTSGISIATGGTVTAANIAMADLAGVNTGALVHYDNLTCSVENNKYYLSDGTTTIQVYNAIYAFGSALVADHIYNITGVYQQYTTSSTDTKEVMPRSAEDIEEVEVQHEEYTLTVSNLSHVNLFVFGDDENETLINTENGETTAQVANGTSVGISIDVETGYEIESLVVDGNDVTSQIDGETGMYTFTMPTHDVTITASAIEYIAPTGGTITFGSAEGSTKINAASVTGNDSMGNTWTITTEGTTSFTQNSSYSQVGSSSKPATSITFTTTLPTEATVTSFEAKFGGFSSTAGTITLKVDETTVGTGSLDATNDVVVSNTSVASGTTLTITVTDIAKGVKCYYISYVVSTSATETHTLEIAGYGNSDGGYYLIASPVASDVTPSAENGFLTDAYDLYWFDQTQEAEWRNYKSGTFDLVSGMGYLYASQEGTTLTFEGTPYDGDGTVSLVKDDDAQFAGWNLVGNPFGVSAYIDRDFYIMNPETGAELIQSSGEIAPMQGIFVIANEDGEDLTFTTEAPGNNNEKLVLNVTRNRGNVIDRAIVRFGQGGMLPKFQLNENNTKISIVEGETEYAVVRSANEGEMPVSFKASENGRYTISVNAENIEMEYLHLIDNMTGANVDLLATPSYSFEANTTDYTSRFRLVFSANNGISEQSNETFAFFNGSNWVVNNNGEATLQVIDMTGRVLSSEQINGSYNKSLNLSAGVYVLRLSNGNVVKTQKVVID